MKNNVSFTLYKFLQLLGTKVTKTSIEEFLESHPDHNTMVGYVDALDKWNIEHAALKIDDENYLEMPTPHITFLRRNGGTFALVKKVTADTIEWYDTSKGWVNENLQNFKKDWSKIVLLAETNENSGELQYKQKRYEEFLQNSKLPFGVFLLCATLVAFISYLNFPFTPYTIPLFGFKLAGILIATLLLIKSIDANNDFINKLCNVGRKISCQSILDSEAAKITSWLSWSDMGFIYFTGTFISFLLCAPAPDNLLMFLSIQLILSGCGVLFSFYSLFYQGVIAKIWCPLCLGIISIFWLEFITLNVYFFTSVKPLFFINTNVISIALIGLSLPLIFLLFYKKNAIEAKKVQKLQSELIQIKTNPEVFFTLIRNQRKMPFLPMGMGVVTIGNKNAKHTLTIVSNPLCTPCAQMHKRIEKLLATTTELKCQIVFIANPNDIDVGGRLVRKIFSLNIQQQQQAVSEWFNRNDRNFDKWNKPYKNIIEKDVAEIWRNEQREWANAAEVKSTPTLFYDGYLMPSMIKVEELMYITQYNNSVDEIIS